MGETIAETVSETVAAATEAVIEATEYESTEAYVEVTESVEPTESIVVESEFVDYTLVINDATSAIASVILAAALMIVGCLMAFKLWEVPYK